MKTFVVVRLKQSLTSNENYDSEHLVILKK